MKIGYDHIEIARYNFFIRAYDKQEMPGFVMRKEKRTLWRANLRNVAVAERGVAETRISSYTCPTAGCALKHGTRRRERDAVWHDGRAHHEDLE